MIVYSSGERAVVLSKCNVGTYVDIERSSFGEDSVLSGFVVDVSDKLAIIQYVSDAFRADGYCIVRNDNITACNLFDDPNCFKLRALRLTGVRFKKLRGIDISDWTTAIKSAGAVYPLLVVHREAVDNTTCLVGRLVDTTSQTITLQTITSTAVWEHKTRLLSGQITRLDFGGGYEEALWKVASENGSAPE